jgi:hypothetical protein
MVNSDTNWARAEQIATGRGRVARASMARPLRVMGVVVVLISVLATFLVRLSSS